MKLKIALESLTKNQLKLLVETCPRILVNFNTTKKEIIKNLENKLCSDTRLQEIACELDQKAIKLIKMFLNKKYRYRGMAQEEFTKFIVYNHRMKNSYTKTVQKLQALGLLFTNVEVREKQRVLFPSEFLRFFNEFLDKNHGH